jgi:acetyl esterase
MPLDQQTAAFLAKANSTPGPAPGDMPLEDFRRAVEPFRALGFDPEEVAAVHRLAIPGPTGAPIDVRLYVPDVAEPVPVVVWAHGGSWVRVTVDLLDGHFRVYANRSGCAIAAVDYRLSPESQFPTALEEVYAVAKWLKAEGRTLGLDPDRMGVAGESSGGNIAAAVALLDRERGDVGFAHQALVIPVLDAQFSTPSWNALGQGYLLTRAQLEWAVEQYAPGRLRTDPLLSPYYAEDLSGLPPALVVTGEYDPLRDEGTDYARRLDEAGVAVDRVEHEGLIHHAIMAPKVIDRGREMVEDTARRIGAALRHADRTAL